MRKYLVCRTDAVEDKMKSSELWPTIVEVENDATMEDIVLRACAKKWRGYIPKQKGFYVIPMEDAAIVRFVPRQDYDVFVENFR